MIMIHEPRRPDWMWEVLTGPQFLVAELSVHDHHASPSEHARHPLCQYRCLWQRAAGNRAQCGDLVTESHQQVHHTRAMDNDKNTPFNSLFSRTICVSWYQIYIKRDYWVLGWQWHRPNNLHLTPDRQPSQHLITQFLRDGCSSQCPTNSVKAVESTEGKLVQRQSSVEITAQKRWQQYMCITY